MILCNSYIETVDRTATCWSIHTASDCLHRPDYATILFDFIKLSSVLLYDVEWLSINELVGMWKEMVIV